MCLCKIYLCVISYTVLVLVMHIMHILVFLDFSSSVTLIVLTRTYFYVAD